jgi:alkylation response protein AidB-like acyl-CoA dehydrogenase
MIQGERPVPDLQLFMLKTADLEIIDDWQVMGLAGTGSKSISVSDLFVPKERVLRNLDVMNGETPGASLHTNPLYRLSVWPLFGFSILAPATGIARGAFELVARESREKALAGDPAFEARRSTTQVHLAEAGALIDTAELLFERGLSETYRLVIENKPLPVELRVRNRRDQAYLAGLCRKAVDILMGLAGGRGIREEGAVQRAFRDLYAISAHPGGNWDAASASYGSVLLGGSPTEMFY